MTDIYTKVNDLYDNKGFLARYGSDIWVSAIICIVFFIGASYFYTLNMIQPIKANWNKDRCNPAVIPFAGIIMGKSGMDAINYTGENFTQCVQSILHNIVGYAFAPIYYLMKTYTKALSEMSDSVNSTRSLFDKIRNSVKELGEDLMSRTLNVTAPLVELIVNTKDIHGKIVGTLTASIYTLFGSYLTLQSLIGAIMQFVFVVLLAMVVMIVVFYIIGILFPFGNIMAAITLVAMLTLLVPYTITEVTLGRVMNIPFPSPPGIPSKPSCFSANTTINLCKNALGIARKKTIDKLTIGDKLVDGSIVTSILKLSSLGQQMYNLNGVLVSGCHQVYDQTNNEWVYVKNHRNSISVNNFTEPFLYCINTTSKTIKLGEDVYLDWDEINENGLKQLQREFKEICKHDIHSKLDGGIHEDMKIRLLDGSFVNINKLKVNDVLCSGEKVYGIVKLDASKLEGGVCEYILENAVKIKCSKNILMKINETEISNTSYLKGNEIKKPAYLYHILTDTGAFTLNGVSVFDYNMCIDKYMDS
jgi:hypothetical protein